MKPVVSRIVRKLINHDQRRLGFISSELQNPKKYCTYRWKNFLSSCFVPQVFYDIGSNNPFSSEGQQTIFRPLMPHTDFYLFEAMPKHEDALRRSGEPYAIVALGDKDFTQRTFYESSIYPSGTGDSCYKENTNVYNPLSTIESIQTVRTLDHVINEKQWPYPDFMKLDTQGSELDILRGATKCLEFAKGLQIECSVRAYNSGAPLIHESISYAQNNGFHVYDISQFHFNSLYQLSQVDIIFLKNEFTKDN